MTSDLALRIAKRLSNTVAVEQRWSPQSPRAEEVYLAAISCVNPLAERYDRLREVANFPATIDEGRVTISLDDYNAILVELGKEAP